MMKKYVRPELSAEVVSDVSEPVYMRCSGQNYFTNLKVAGDYEHQVPEDGRADCRYHADGGFKAPVGYVYTGPVYCYLKFPIAGVTIDHVNDWEQVNTYEENGCTYWIGVQTYTLQNNNSIGLGDLIAHMTVSPGDNCPIPDISFSFGYDGSSCV